MNRAELEASAASFESVLEQAPDFANAWFMLGEIRHQLGQTDAAIAAYRKSREVDPTDILGASLKLARLGAETARAMPGAYVRGIFDQYAARFDSDLVETLGYRAPALLRAAVDTACEIGHRAAEFNTMLDLGCGTGLAGAVFRDCAHHMTGVDLSPAMIAVAKEKKLYDRLEADDIMDFLRTEKIAGQGYALIVVADVFVYFADLTGVCAAAAAVMAPGALFAFTVETHPGNGFVLRETMRFAHGIAHVREALASLTILEMTQVSTRNDAGEPVPGLLVVARRDAPLPA